MGETALKRLTVDEFLVWDNDSQQRYELIHGEVVAMAPTSNAHAQIVANASGEVRARLKPPCRVMNEVGIRLSVRDDTYYEADVAVVCSPVDPHGRGIRNPVVIIEVLSPSTMAKDSRVKLPDYRRVWSVKEVLLIHSEEKHVELWRRGEGVWTVIDLEAANTVALESLRIEFPVEALYEGLDFSQGAAAQG
jgi:Uma2 family endonuclease